ncbi:MAG: zf-TFIIB domain-containing protein [Arenicellales bacterium]
MHVIVSCNQCTRQYDTIGRAAGEKFHCICGQLITLPERRSYEAAVVRCSACGGVRVQNNQQCGFCGADFTLHEQDLQTVCPECLTRINNQSKYCHHCATPIVVVGKVGKRTQSACPHCRNKSVLSIRKIKSSKFNALECTLCAGIWLDTETFLALERKMIELSSSGISREHRKVTAGLPRTQGGDQNLYRKCPSCDVIMHRRNYGPGSGIVIDQCKDHGFWFDQRELSVILRWIRTGGLLASSKRRAAMDRDRDRVAKIVSDIDKYQKRLSGRHMADYYFKL